MIPQRVYLKGLLCYRGEQELHLADAPIWMLSGPNGSGKSAVFDAVTFALFGYHRGGKTNARELINKDEDGLVVEFDVLLDGELFRLRRTASKRGSGTRQIRHWRTGGEQGGIWEAVPDTDMDRGFDEWVRERVGLTYESFTSSVLLLQGQAERVLSPRPSERREILESIVDLNRYRRMHERVDEKRKQLKIQAETLGKQLQAIPKTHDSDFVAAQSQLAACEQAMHAANAETERLQGLQYQAEQWTRLETSLAASRTSLDQAQELSTNADAIRTGWQRLQELRDVLPHLKAASDQHGRIAAAEQTIADFSSEEARLTRQVAELESLLAQSQQRRQCLAGQIATDEMQLQSVGARLRELSELVGRVHASEQQLQEFAELHRQLALLPADAEEKLERTQREHDELLAIRQILSPMTRLHVEREALRQLTWQLNAATEAERILVEKERVLNLDCAETGRRLEAAATNHRLADRQATEARALRDQAARRIRDFRELAGDLTCGYCGQSLTASHVETELARREANLAALETQLTTAIDARAATEQRERQIQDDRKAVEGLLIQVRERVHEERQNVNAYRRDRQKHADACQRIYDDELDGTSRQRVADRPPVDWLSTTYPAPDDLDEMQRQAGRLSELREALRLARSRVESVTKLRDRAEFIGQSITAQHGKLPTDPATLRNDYEQKASDELWLKARLTEYRGQLERESQSAEVLTTQRNDTQRQLSAKQAELRGIRDQRKEAHSHLVDCRHGLPRDWQVTADSVTVPELRDLQNELTQLLEQGLDARYGALLQAQADASSLQATVMELERRCNELPAEARQPVAEIKRLLAIAKGHRDTHEKALTDAQLRADRLIQRHHQRQQLREECLQVSRQHRLYQILAELLGPRRLQRELMRHAEREIVDLANNMLDRVSGGQLELTLAGQAEDEGSGMDRNVFQLEARNRGTATVPLGVAFLSGSQRFRVAVSLALGMGQYASARRRSIQSVIIDEGFGSLDREGRQVMVQELQNLRGHLERIVLVSHQEEFADAFPDGYRFELKDGATQVSRFHR